MEKRNLSTARYYGDVWNNAGLGESAFMGYLFASIDWIARGSGECLKFVHTSSNTNVLGQKKRKKKLYSPPAFSIAFESEGAKVMAFRKTQAQKSVTLTFPYLKSNAPRSKGLG